MEIFEKILILSLLVHGSISVKVYLEGGSTKNVDKEVDKGSTETLVCSLTSTSAPGTPSLQWLFSQPGSTSGNILVDGTKVSDTDKYGFIAPFSLSVKNFNTDDTGIYRCQGTLVGDQDSYAYLSYNITVLVPPYQQISCGFPGDLAITLDSPTEFRCSEVVQTAVPAPSFTWFKDGLELPLKSSDNPLYDASDFSYSKSTGVLKFAKVVSADAGQYYCTAKNKVGEESCKASEITTKEQNVGVIVGIVFGVIFALILIGVLIWWTWRQGYCDGLTGEKDIDDDARDDGANDIMLDGAGPLVTKEPSEFSNSNSHKDSMRSSGPHMPEGAVRVMP